MQRPLPFSDQGSTQCLVVWVSNVDIFSQSSESEKNKMPLRLSSLSVNTSFK